MNSLLRPWQACAYPQQDYLFLGMVSGWRQTDTPAERGNAGSGKGWNPLG